MVFAEGLFAICQRAFVERLRFVVLALWCDVIIKGASSGHSSKQKTIPELSTPGPVLDPAKILRCTKCKACFYCSPKCQKRNWKRIHKHVCSTDPSIRPFIRVEMAIERALAEKPPLEEAPKDARCYICLGGDDDGKSKLIRGCACRGDSAGFVHLECLTELAKSKEGDPEAVGSIYMKCVNCKQLYVSGLLLRLVRRFWQRHRASIDRGLRYACVQFLAACLEDSNEDDAANALEIQAKKMTGNTEELDVNLAHQKAMALIKDGKNLEALELMKATKSKVKHDGDYSRTMLKIATALLALERYDECFETAAELVAFTKGKYGLNDARTLNAMQMHAHAGSKLGRVVESLATLTVVLTIRTRIYGPDHPDTQLTRAFMPSADRLRDLDDSLGDTVDAIAVLRDLLDNGIRALDG